MRRVFLKLILMFNLLIDLLMIGFCVTIGNYGFIIVLILAVVLSIVAIQYLRK